jgi:hypothetical protein
MGGGGKSAMMMNRTLIALVLFLSSTCCLSPILLMLECPASGGGATARWLLLLLCLCRSTGVPTPTWAVVESFQHRAMNNKWPHRSRSRGEAFREHVGTQKLQSEKMQSTSSTENDQLAAAYAQRAGLWTSFMVAHICAVALSGRTIIDKEQGSGPVPSFCRQNPLPPFTLSKKGLNPLESRDSKSRWLTNKKRELISPEHLTSRSVGLGWRMSE